MAQVEDWLRSGGSGRTGTRKYPAMELSPGQVKSLRAAQSVDAEASSAAGSRREVLGRTKQTAGEYQRPCGGCPCSQIPRLESRHSARAVGQFAAGGRPLPDPGAPKGSCGVVLPLVAAPR